jgi:glycosyltransferase 2 family protein
VNTDWKRILPGLVISVLALAVVFYFADLRQTLAALRRAELGYAALGLLSSFAWLGVRGIAWRTILQGRARYRHVLLSLAEGYLLNNLLPFRLGEVGRAFLLGRKANLTFWEVFPTIMIERILDLAFAAGLLLGSLSFVVGLREAEGTALVVGGLMLVGLAGLYLLARFHATAESWFERLGARFPPLLRFGGPRLASFFQGLQVLTDPRRFLAAVFWMALNWGLGVVQYYLFIRAFVPEATLLMGALTLAVTSLGIAAPSSPGALGVLELSIIAGLAVFRVDHSTALAVALIVRLSSYLLSGVLGSYALSQEGDTLRGLYQRLRGIAQSPG